MGKTFNVFDRNAVEGPREHDHIDAAGKIKRYVFNRPDEGVELPKDEALRFLGKDGFDVMDGDTPVLPTPQSQPGLTNVSIADGQCIAWFQELTQEALYRRAVQILPSGILQDETSREALIELLTGRGGLAQTAPDREELPEDEPAKEPAEKPAKPAAKPAAKTAAKEPAEKADTKASAE